MSTVIKPSTTEYVCQDLLERQRIGTHVYGTELRPFNGRNSLQDAYEECLDMAIYLKNALLERQEQT